MGSKHPDTCPHNDIKLDPFPHVHGPDCNCEGEGVVDDCGIRNVEVFVAQVCTNCKKSGMGRTGESAFHPDHYQFQKPMMPDDLVPLDAARTT